MQDERQWRRDQKIGWLAEALPRDPALRQQVAVTLVQAAPDFEIGYPEDYGSMRTLVAAAAMPFGAAGECRMETPAGSLRPVLRPSPTDPERAELCWCCTGHSVEHCSGQVTR